MIEDLSRPKSTLDPRLAHDLRSKINAVLLALDVVDLGETEHRAEALKRVRRSARDISDLVDKYSGVVRGASFPQAEVTPRVRHGTRVLLVEDEYLLARSVAEHLNQAGCKVIGPAGSIDDALGLVAQEAIDCAVVDANLDGEFSTPVVEALCAKGIPAMALSGYDEAALPAAFRALPFLQKPVNVAQLLKHIAVSTAVG